MSKEQIKSSVGDVRNFGVVRGPMLPTRIEKAKNPRATLQRLLTYFHDFRAGIYGIVALIIVYTLLGLAGPYLMGLAIDQYISLRRTSGLWTIVGLMAAAFALNNLFQTIVAWKMADLSQKALAKLRADLFGHIQALPLQFFDTNSSGELMSRLTNDVEAINLAAAQNIVALVASLFSMVGIIIAMFVLNHWLAIASVLVVPLMVWFTGFIASYTRRGFAKLQRDLGVLNGVMEESVSGQRVVSAFNRKDLVYAKFSEANEQVYQAGIDANTYALLLMPLTSVLGNLFVIVLASFGGWLALHQLVTVGVIATFIHYGQNFINPLRQVANLYNTIQAAIAGAERVFATLDTSLENNEGSALVAASVKGHIRFDSVTFGYDPDRPIVENMSLEALPGEMIAIVGPTGAGKTTIINLLTRFYEINAGEIYLDGVPIRTIQKPQLRAVMGLVLQETVMFSDTVMQNIRYGRLDATDAEVIAAAELADADHFIRQLANGYQTMLSEQASNLSQGQRQLLAIARVILANPAILILDEATSSIDTRTELHIQRALARLMKGRTSFVIAHRLSTIRDASRVVVVNQGRIVESGSHDELITRQGVYYNLYTSQFKGHAI